MSGILLASVIGGAVMLSIFAQAFMQVRERELAVREKELALHERELSMHEKELRTRMDAIA